MEVFNILLLVALLILSVWHIVEDEYNPIKLGVFICLAVCTFISFAYETTKACDTDVFNGNAEYIETIHISRGDTIKTYHIQYKQKK
jgi:hypothetical protein